MCPISNKLSPPLTIATSYVQWRIFILKINLKLYKQNQPAVEILHLLYSLIVGHSNELLQLQQLNAISDDSDASVDFSQSSSLPRWPYSTFLPSSSTVQQVSIKRSYARPCLVMYTLHCVCNIKENAPKLRMNLYKISSSSSALQWARWLCSGQIQIKMKSHNFFLHVCASVKYGKLCGYLTHLWKQKYQQYFWFPTIRHCKQINCVCVLVTFFLSFFICLKSNIVNKSHHRQ